MAKKSARKASKSKKAKKSASKRSNKYSRKKSAKKIGGGGRRVGIGPPAAGGTHGAGDTP